MSELHSIQRTWAHWCGDWGTALLRRFPAEMSHEIGMRLLRSPLTQYLVKPQFSGALSGLDVSIPGIGQLKHPIGLAAGFDKNATSIPGLAQMGFSFMELGTVTPLAQPGNPKPRLFRAPAQRALVNRMGFNSDGASRVLERLDRLAWNHTQVPLGINVGKNKQTEPEHAAEDYLRCFELLRDHGRYFVFNLSSPNTPGLRGLANKDFIAYLAERLQTDVSKVWLKLDPDMGRATFQGLVEAIGKHNFQGIILCNTHRVTLPEPGGLSGHPLAVAAASRLEWAHEVHRGDMLMIASGGISSGIDVFERLARGASAVQIYAALVYRGPYAVLSMIGELIHEMKMRGITRIEEVIGVHYDET